MVHDEDAEDLPGDVDSAAKLQGIPPEYLSGQVQKPLKLVVNDDDNNGEEEEEEEERLYVLKPMFYSVVFILLVELLERFAYYGLNFTGVSFLSGVYDPDWNPGLSAVAASSDVSISIFVAYTSTFLGALLADSAIGDYWTIVGSLVLFYIPGLVLIALSTVPGLLVTGGGFNVPLLLFAFCILWPVGTGCIKSVVNVFGAKQFHPVLQRQFLQTYYINFYLVINIGALGGGFLIPILTQHNLPLAYTIPVLVLVCGLFVFLAGTPRYIRTKPKGELCQPQLFKNETSIVEMVGLTALIIPFNIVYYQMTTTFIVQGNVMKKAWGFLDAAGMNNIDTLSVLWHGYFVGHWVFPYLSKKGIVLETTTKFAIGSFLATVAVAWILGVEYAIHRAYHKHTELSVLWQTPAYVCIGAGEIFSIAAAYELAFRTASARRKALASAVNLFLIGGVPSFLCAFLYQLCAPFFRTGGTGSSNIATLPNYTQARVYDYFWVILLISLSGVVVNLLPCVQKWVTWIEKRAQDNIASSSSSSSSDAVDTEKTNLLATTTGQKVEYST